MTRPMDYWYEALCEQVVAPTIAKMRQDAYALFAQVIGKPNPFLIDYLKLHYWWDVVEHPKSYPTDQVLECAEVIRGYVQSGLEVEV